MSRAFNDLAGVNVTFTKFGIFFIILSFGERRHEQEEEVATLNADWKSVQQRAALAPRLHVRRLFLEALQCFGNESCLEMPAAPRFQLLAWSFKQIFASSYGETFFSVQFSARVTYMMLFVHFFHLSISFHARHKPHYHAPVKDTFRSSFRRAADALSPARLPASPKFM